MRIYKISPDLTHYKQLRNTEGEPKTSERIKELSFSGDQKTSYWTPLTLKWIEKEDVDGPDRDEYDTLKIPDIGYWYPGCLVLSPKATAILKPLFCEEAEFLPVEIGREDWEIINITNIQNAVSEVIKADGVNRWIDKIVFDSSKLTNAKLFRDIVKPIRLITSDVPGSIKEVVEANGLTGLEFDEY